jgi:NACHT domain
MTSRIGKRLPEVKTLYDMLPKGTEGGKEFARIVDLLLFHEARRSGKKVTIFSDVAGDYHGLDSFESDVLRRGGTTGYQYKFYPSPLSGEHRQSIVQSLKKIAETQKQLKLKKWILVTPQDLTESATRKDGGDVSWFESLHDELGLKFELEHWGHKKLLLFFLETHALCLYYYPELINNGVTHKKTIEDIRKRYDDNLPILYSDIQFVGMSVYKQEATQGVPMEHIYIPLSVIPETQNEQDTHVNYINPLSFLLPGSRHVLLGDPGSGKSTLLRFLALAGVSEPLQKRYKAHLDKRLPILITLRRYADELKSRHNLSLIDYIQESIQADFTLKDADFHFFEYYLETGQTLLFFDGLDELPSSHFKQIIRDRIRTLIKTYPGNTTIVTSRIVGYENPFQFDKKEFGHYRVAKLRLPEMEQFVRDWYRARIENEREREANVKDLIRILDDKNHIAIRELAENPLLLTIVALVHRIDAVLPDERVVLYQKCTETLLNTWHTWKFRGQETRNKGKVERRNRHRIEAIANWMHCQSGGIGKNQRAVVPYEDLRTFLITHITKVEKVLDPDKDPEDLAEEFLEFIKKRAGLLIELGDNQYSFVHLTFQEYLASSYIITMGEKEGVSGIWETIKDHCNDPRWHEIIRLIVAGLKNDESQQFIIDQLLSKNENEPRILKSHILGGLLLDGIEAAEIHKKEIVTSLFHLGSIAVDVEQLRRVTSLLQSLNMKEGVGEEFLCSIFQSLWDKVLDEEQKIALTLVASITGISETNFLELAQDILIEETREADLFKLFLLKEPKATKNDSVIQDIKLLWALQDLLLLSSPSGNFVAAVMQTITSSLKPHIATKRFFQEQLVTLSTGLSGPFYDFNANSLRIRFSGFYPNFTLTEEQSEILHRFRDLDLARDRKQFLVQTRERDEVRNLALVQTRVREMAQDLDREMVQDLDLIQDRARTRVLALDQDQDLNTEERSWQNVIAISGSYSPILDLLCETFNLKPRVQWWEALRVSFLPIVPERINLFDQAVWIQTEDAFAQDKASETDVYSAAWQLLFDAWLYIFGYYNLPKETIFGRLADLTQAVDAAPLCIAHCIRDLAYGDKTRAEDLASMVQSQNPAYRSIFEAAYWRSTPEEDAKREKPKRKSKKEKG